MKDIMVISRAGVTPMMPGLMVLCASDEGLVYKWKVPPDVAATVDKGTGYIYRDKGIPELGIARDGLYVVEPVYDPGSTTKFSSVAVMAKSIQKEVGDINALVKTEQRKTTPSSRW